MRSLFLLFLSIIFFSCSDPLEWAYSSIALEEDMIELKKIISEDELNRLLEYIALNSSLGVDMVGKTYNDLLNEMKTKKVDEIVIDTDDFQYLLNERLEDHRCDDFIIERDRKENHNHNDNEIWDDDDYLIDY